MPCFTNLLPCICNSSQWNLHVNPYDLKVVEIWSETFAFQCFSTINLSWLASCFAAWHQTELTFFLAWSLMNLSLRNVFLCPVITSQFGLKLITLDLSMGINNVAVILAFMPETTSIIWQRPNNSFKIMTFLTEDLPRLKCAVWKQRNSNKKFAWILY